MRWFYQNRSVYWSKLLASISGCMTCICINEFGSGSGFRATGNRVAQSKKNQVQPKPADVPAPARAPAVDCLKIAEDKSSDNRIHTSDARMIKANDAVSRCGVRNPHLDNTAVPKHGVRSPRLNITAVPKCKARGPRLHITSVPKCRARRLRFNSTAVPKYGARTPVSYTHLTLPTIYSV